MTLVELLSCYRNKTLSPREMIGRARAQALADDHHSWIRVLSEAELEPYLARLESMAPESLPLYGVPFAIKDNIDLAGIPTTAACPDFSFVPDRSATVVERLIEAGAVPIGKTNLDQFATGLVGTRSPYGACTNAFNPDYISGGSSSGSAVSLALGQVVFSLGTDTAGSGRVPASFNNLVGLKPTRGLLSTRGVVPACRSLDCVSIFALTPEDAAQVMAVAAGFDEEDAYSRRFHPELAGQAFGAWRDPIRLAVPQPGQLEFFGDAESERIFTQALAVWGGLGAELVEVDITPLREAAQLLYEGPWVAERYLAVEFLLTAKPDALLPVTRQIIDKDSAPTATDLFRAQYRLQALQQQAQSCFRNVDALLLPTCVGHFTQAEVSADPIGLNSQLGTYTNFMNLLDCCAVATPVGFRANGLPWGATLCAPAMHDLALLSLAQCFAEAQQLPLGNDLGPFLPASFPAAPAGRMDILVCGAHLTGLPLNPQLTSRGALFKQATRTAPRYRFYALAGGPPFRPGLIRDETEGGAIEVEIWSVPVDQVGTFLAGIPFPLGLGKVEMEDGQWVTGFVCDPSGLEGAEDITPLGGWRAYLAR